MYLYIFDNNNNNIFLRFLDFFRGPVVDNIRLQGLEHVYMFTAHKGMIYLRSYRLVIILFLWDILNGYKSTTLWNFHAFRVVSNGQYAISYSWCRVGFKKSGSRTPRVELEEMGPSLDLCLRRTKLASDDLYKRALRQPKTAKVSYF